MAYLVCKKCGYKQHDEETIKYYSDIHLDNDIHDIPYYCGACLDNADEEEYEEMITEMEGD